MKKVKSGLRRKNKGKRSRKRKRAMVMAMTWLAVLAKVLAVASKDGYYYHNG